MWLLLRATKLHSKNFGCLLHISNFILEKTGWLKMSANQFKMQQNSRGSTLISNDASTIIYLVLKGDSGETWSSFTTDSGKNQIQSLNPFIQTYRLSSSFDWSPEHSAYGKSALRAQNMNFKPDGKQAWVKVSIIPDENPLIPPHLSDISQLFLYSDYHPDSNLAGHPKQVHTILEEQEFFLRGSI